ncbi:hypothetical protein [Colwellia sp. UCD-KL20]|uniref:hypothetical protein n=1 Tax=Colwellia sp. UCD-KL20 TaxID=1917165 RepID=UPI0009706C83|nr:hypothetical protein [Colwellia sp. UCD-KL20]
MIKIKTILFLFAFFVFCFLGCGQNEKYKNEIIEPKCISTQMPCLINSSIGDFSILFNVEPVFTENPFDIVLISKSKLPIKSISAHMEGKNMFMGKIPLFFEINQVKKESYEKVNPTYYVANTMLGSCSEENMRWIILFEITIENQQGIDVIENFSIEFDSVQTTSS